MSRDELDRLLQAERTRPGFEAAEREALWKGIDLATAPLGSVDLSPDAPRGEPNLPPAAHATPFAAWKIGALAAATALGGAGLGALAHAQWAVPRVVVIERTVPSPTVSVALPSLPETPPPQATSRPDFRPAVSALTARPAPARPAESAASSATSLARDPNLARERTLLDMARTALTRGDTAAALDAVTTHSREFPRSQLTEEREVLAIQALASANQRPEARRRADAFRANFPRSALLPIVDESTQ